jgi:DNA-binding SARP family transcriptional activator/tetratricopeptide (TPR) repeat protein
MADQTPLPAQNVVEIGLLGPLDVRVAGRPVAVTAPRLRGLLVGMALSAGAVVTVDRLAAVVWGDETPDDTRRSLRTYVNRLRGLLGADLITTAPAGYQLHVSPEQVDALRFVQLLDSAAGAPDTAAERSALTQALALWRGTPFEGVPSSWLEQSESPRLVELYLSAVERRTDIDLADGHAHEVVAELRALTAQHTIRESLWMRLLVALDRSGRQAEALDRYEVLRGHLAEELGVDPGPELRAVHAAVLAHGAAIDGGNVRPAAVPRQLPADIDAFTGRHAELAALHEIMRRHGTDRNRPLVMTIMGTAGVGKTALAVHWAHQVADRFPDGTLHVDLRGFDPARPVPPPAEVIRGFLDALGVPPSRIPDNWESQAALYRSLLADRRVLVLLDNARDAEQVRPLLPGSGGSLAVVTSRDQLSGLVVGAGARPVVLDLLTVEDARRLMTRHLGRARVAAEPDALDEIIARCARLPLALAVAAARAVTNPAFALTALAGQLRVAQGDLDVFAGGDPATDVRSVLSWSYRTLNADAARLFRLLGLHPGAEFGVCAAASLAGLPRRQTRALLGELTRAHLVREHLPGRYSLHDLLRAYAAELVDTADPAHEVRAASHRVLDHYLQTAYAAALLIYRRDPIRLVRPLPGVVPDELADHAQAMSWLTAEQPTLLAAADLAADAGLDTHIWQLAWTLYSYFDWQGRWREQEDIQRAGLEATIRLGEKAAQARIQINLAQVHMRVKRFAEAHQGLRRALDLYAELGDKTGQARAHLNLCQLFGREGQHDRAAEHGLLALDLLRAVDNQGGQADALNEVGWCYAMLGEYQRTISYCEQALDLNTRLGHRHGMATTWDSLAYAHHHLGARAKALDCYEQALSLYRDLGDRYREAETLAHLGDTHHASAATDVAQKVWRQALKIFDELGHPDADDVRAKLHPMKSM